jgi:hypothetical protein
MGFIDEHRALFLESLRRDPGRYLRAVAHRLLAVTVNYVPFKAAPFNDNGDQPLKDAVQRGIYALPFAMLLTLLALRRRAPSPSSGLAVFYGLYLLPYVATAFYPRYLIPLTPILVIFVFFAVDRVAAVCLRQTPGMAESYR